MSRLYNIINAIITPFGKSLWTGSWSSGEITVPGSSKYCVFLIGIKDDYSAIGYRSANNSIRILGGNHPRWNHRDKRIVTRIRHFQNRVYASGYIACKSKPSSTIQCCSDNISINQQGIFELLSNGFFTTDGIRWRNTIRGSLCEIVAHPERGCC